MDTLLLTRVEIDAPQALRLAIASDARTAADTGYVVKSALAALFAPGAIRPWRIVEMDDVSIIIEGWSTGTVLPGNGSEDVHPDLLNGIVMNIQQTPVTLPGTCRLQGRVVPLRRSGAAKRSGRPFIRDAAEGAGSPSEAYRDWIVQRLSAEGSGLRLLAEPKITRARKARVMRKLSRGVGEVMQPDVAFEVEVEVTDAAAAHAFLLKGVGPQKCFGYGFLGPKMVES